MHRVLQRIDSQRPRRGVIQTVSPRNYADGEWHYVIAKYDPGQGTNGQLTLTLVNEDGTVDRAISSISSSFRGLPTGGDGNLFIGREDFAVGQPFTGLGLILVDFMALGYVDRHHGGETIEEWMCWLCRVGVAGDSAAGANQ